MDNVTINTIKSIKAELEAGKRQVKAIARDCRFSVDQVSDDWSKAAFARLSDCKTRKEFYAVIESLLN